MFIIHTLPLVSCPVYRHHLLCLEQCFFKHPFCRTTDKNKKHVSLSGLNCQKIENYPAKTISQQCPSISKLWYTHVVDLKFNNEYLVIT